MVLAAKLELFRFPIQVEINAAFPHNSLYFQINQVIIMAITKSLFRRARRSSGKLTFSSRLYSQRIFCVPCLTLFAPKRCV